MQENTDQKKLGIWTLFTQWMWIRIKKILKYFHQKTYCHQRRFIYFLLIYSFGKYAKVSQFFDFFNSNYLYPFYLQHLHWFIFLKARIHCEIFLSEHFMKYVVLLCKLPRNVHVILFEAFHEIWKFCKSIFRTFSIVKDFPIEFVFMFDQFSFVINDVCKNLKQNVNIKVKSKHKVVFRTLYWKNWKIDSSSFFRIMNEKDFNFDAITRFQAY